MHNNYQTIFSHPDCTVGSGISPDQPNWLAGFVYHVTAGREFHPALKNRLIFNYLHYNAICFYWQVIITKNQATFFYLWLPF